MPEVSVREMQEREFDDWYEESTRFLAASQVAGGNWPAEEALERAHESRRALLPQGRATAGMVFLRALRPDGTPVGAVWLGLTHPRGVPDCAFLYFLEVGEAHRGAGYGRALLEAAEELARSRGANSLELNVFGYNDPAVRLYETAGYRVVTQQMRKSWDGHRT
ncbi:GNAT family N-acetyltransferase [Actinoplanes sp. NPDC049681]|uniref:GNAT family N-acetyltransferase n=1 Tax=Actinoplanes sp. NPDC049681 TaxID=3363905 RepID=UPI0037A46E87